MSGNPLLTVLAFIVLLGVLITVHEFGHFWVARRLGVKVLRFSVGFGKPFWRRLGRDGVEYVVTVLPLGGYVKMLDEREGNVAPAELPRAFNRQPIPARMAIVLAGPFSNLLFAALVYALMFMHGVPDLKPVLDAPKPGSLAAAGGFEKGDLIVAIAGKPTAGLSAVQLELVDRAMAGAAIEVEVRDAEDQTRIRVLAVGEDDSWEETAMAFTQLGLRWWQPTLPAVIGQLTRGGAAERAGLQPGDRVVWAAEQAIADWEQWRTVIQRHPGQPFSVRIVRDGVEHTLQVTPEVQQARTGERIGLIGAIAEVPDDLAEDLRVVVRYGPLAALGAGVGKVWDMSLLTLRMLGRMLIGKASLENISGPLTIAQFAGQAASAGLLTFLSLLALISVSLGVLNLLPIPILDGGHLLYDLIELIKGSPLSEAVQGMGQQVGIVVLVLLMGLALFNDFNRLLG